LVIPLFPFHQASPITMLVGLVPLLGPFPQASLQPLLLVRVIPMRKVSFLVYRLLLNGCLHIVVTSGATAATTALTFVSLVSMLIAPVVFNLL
jgi:hypothetical protein